MAPTGTSQLIEKFPLELLGKVLAYVPILDILRMKQVGNLNGLIRGSPLNCFNCLHQINRSFRDFIKNSPYIKYRIDLFTAGLVDNPAVNLTLADKRRAFDTHRMKWETFSTVKKWQRIVGGGYRARAPGVYAFVAPPAKFSEFLTLESISRGIPRKEWRVPSPDPALSNLAINPHVDVLIVAIKREPGWVFQISESRFELNDELQPVYTTYPEHDKRSAPSRCRKSNHHLPTHNRT